MATYVFASLDSSAADRAAASSGCLYNGTAWTNDQKQKFAVGGNTIELKAGTYAYQDVLMIGANTTVRGPRIAVPAKKRTYLSADPSTMAVLASSRSIAASNVEVAHNTHADIETNWGASNVTISDIYMQGYCCLKMPGIKNSTISRVVINNYNGTYPSGSWANMGYGDATGAFWITGGSGPSIVLSQCVAQFSSHHGFCIHSGGNVDGVTFDDCRALSCGCGWLKGDKSGDISESEGIAALKYRNGCGYMDWSVGFDLNESCSVTHIIAKDCYAFDCWKAGFYQEPGYSNTNTQLIRCVAEENGQRACLADGRMIPRESEHSNFYLQAGNYLEGCISRNGRKAGFDLYPEMSKSAQYNGSSYRIAMIDCVDCGSRYGIICGPGAASDVLIHNFRSLNNPKRALNLFGSGPYTIRGLVVKTQNPTRSPIVLGRYCRVNLAESLSTSQAATFTAGLSLSQSMTIAMSGTVEGLNSGVAPYEVKNSSVTTSQIALQTAASATATAICEAESTASPGTPGPGEGETPGAIVAAFTGSPTSGTAPLTVTFTDQTEGAVSWVWSFGDGTTSTLKNPVHVYTVPGTYPVALAVSDGSYYDSEPKAGYVRVHAADGTIPDTPASGRTFKLSTPQIVQAYDGDSVINATVTIRIDEGS